MDAGFVEGRQMADVGALVADERAMACCGVTWRGRRSRRGCLRSRRVRADAREVAVQSLAVMGVRSFCKRLARRTARRRE